MKSYVKLIAIYLAALVLTGGLSVLVYSLFGEIACIAVNFIVILPLELFGIYYILKKKNSSKS